MYRESSGFFGCIIRKMKEEVFTEKQTREVIRYVQVEYGDELEFLWEGSLENAIWRNARNRKWYGLIMAVRGRKLGLEMEEKMEILDLRFDKNAAREFAASSEYVLPGYHMNKNNWITIVLDGRMATEEILRLLDHSYELVDRE